MPPALIRGMSTFNRVPPGVPAGGQFAENQRPEAPQASLGGWDEASYQAGYLDALSAVRETLGTLDAPAAPTEAEPAAGLADAADTTPMYARDHSQRSRAYEPAELEYHDVFPAAIDVSDAAVQDGGVFDVVSSHGTTFYRRRPGIYAERPQAVRIQCDRPLGATEIEQMRNLMGYQFYARVAKNPTGRAQVDSPRSFTFTIDPGEADSAVLDRAFVEYEASLPALFAEGTPKRKTQGHTRKYEGLVNPPRFELYYDSVSWDRQESADYLNGLRQPRR